MEFQNDIFISYSHVDNRPLGDGDGWITDFHEALETRVLQWLGWSDHELTIWRDPKLRGNDDFSAELEARVPDSAVLVSVVSPRYVQSEWCTKELELFVEAAREVGRLTVADNQVRVFKVLKMPVPLAQQPSPLERLLGYEFYSIEGDSGRARELNRVFGTEAERDFFLKLDDLAWDIARLLMELSGQGATAVTPPDPAKPKVFLAETTSDAAAAYDGLRRDLIRNGYAVLPDRPLPLHGAELEEIARSALAECRLSVHMIGAAHAVVPEGASESLAAIQNELAAERSAAGQLERLIWIDPEADVTDPRQRQFVDALLSGSGLDDHADLLQRPLEDLKTAIWEQLASLERSTRGASPPTEAQPGIPRIYLICDGTDLEGIGPLHQHLFDSGYDIDLPVFEGDEQILAQEHEARLARCDAALVYYGAGGDAWLSRMLWEVEERLGERGEVRGAIGVYVAPPVSPAKSLFRSRAATVVQALEGFTPTLLAPFLETLGATSP